MLASIEHLITQVDPLIAYLILFVSAFVENTFPPIPGDTVTVIGAYLITTGKLTFLGVWLSTTVGSVSGFFTMYLIGARLGIAFLKKESRAKIFPAGQIVKAEVWFDKYGLWVILANRFLSGTRSVISLFAGIFKLKWIPVLLFATISALIWNGLLMWGGLLLGNNWQHIMDIVSDYNKIVLLLSAIVILLLGIRWYRKKQNKKSKQ